MLVKTDVNLHQMVSGSLAFLDSLANKKKSENFPYKTQGSRYFGFVGQTVSVAIFHLCPCSSKAATEKI